MMSARPFASVVTMFVAGSDLPYPFNTIAEMEAWVRNSRTLDVEAVISGKERSGGTSNFTKDVQA